MMTIINSQIISGGGSGPTGLYREFQLDATGKLVPNTTTTHIMDFTGVTDVDTYVLTYAYSNNTAISGTVNMSDLTTLNGGYACCLMFQNCTGLTSVDLSALTVVNGSNACYGMFQNCTGITSVDLSSLTTVRGSSACRYMFNNCTGLTVVDLSSLTTVSSANACGNMFYNCTSLTSANLSGLTTVTGGTGCANMFYGCTSLATVYIGGTTAIDFGTYTNQFVSMFTNCPQNIDVYAPAASQSAIEGLTDYPNFGGAGTVTWHWRS